MVDPLQVNTFYFIKKIDRFFHTAALSFRISLYDILYDKIANKRDFLKIINLYLRRKSVKESSESCCFMALIEKKIDYKWNL